MKWKQNPVIVTFAETLTPVWTIPFPAVTICPETKALKTHIDITKGYRAVVSNYTEFNLTRDEKRKLEAVAQVCESVLFRDYEPINSELNSNEIVALLKDMAISMEDTMVYCKWKSRHCMHNFVETITDEGICFTFNTLNSSELITEDISPDFRFNLNKTSPHWTLENGYTISDFSTYPKRVFGAGARAGMNMILKLKTSDIDYQCRGAVQGFKVILHLPNELPLASKNFFRVPLHQEVMVNIKPNMITTSSGLAGYEPNSRQCYFNHEKYLRFFKSYTQSNCEIECLANYTLYYCKCVKFSMPRDNVTKICDQKDIECYEEAEDELLFENYDNSLRTNPETVESSEVPFCNCLPSCTSINYEAETSQADFEFQKVLDAKTINYIESLKNMSLARMKIFFKDAQFRTSKRSELYGLTDFISNCGGLLGELELFQSYS